MLDSVDVAALTCGADFSRAFLGIVFSNQGNFSRTGGNQPLIGTTGALPLRITR